MQIDEKLKFKLLEVIVEHTHFRRAGATKLYADKDYSMWWSPSWCTSRWSIVTMKFRIKKYVKNN